MLENAIIRFCLSVCQLVCIKMLGNLVGVGFRMEHSVVTCYMGGVREWIVNLRGKGVLAGMGKKAEVVDGTGKSY